MWSHGAKKPLLYEVPSLLIFGQPSMGTIHFCPSVGDKHTAPLSNEQYTLYVIYHSEGALSFSLRNSKVELKSAFGQILQWGRVKQKLTQEDFATVSSRTYISTLERGRYVPTIQKLDTIAPVLGVHPVTLMVGSYALKENRPAKDLLAQSSQEADRLDLEAALSDLSKTCR